MPDEVYGAIFPPASSVVLENAATQKNPNVLWTKKLHPTFHRLGSE